MFDMIRVLGGQKNPHDAWARLVESHPEVLGKCENLQFPVKALGADQAMLVRTHHG